MNPRMQRIAHTIAALIAGALVILPDLLPLLAGYPRAARIVGAVLLVLTNATKIPGFAALLAKYGAPPAPEKLPKPAPNVPVVGLALVLGSLLLAGQAQAQPRTVQALGCIDAANTYCVVPAAAVGWQVNLKTGGVANAVSLVGLTLQHTFGTLPVGLGIYAGLGMSTANQGSQQACLGASITNWGLLCGGVQRATFPGGGTALQGMLTFAPQLTFGGTPAYVQGAR